MIVTDLVIVLVVSADVMEDLIVVEIPSVDFQVVIANLVKYFV